MQRNSKEKIVEAAIGLFAEKGYTETTMKEIASACGIKAATIYNYFPSKKKLLEHIIGLYANISRGALPFLTEGYIRENHPRAVLHQLFFRFEGENAHMYKQIIKIFMQEQYRIDDVREFMKTQYIENTQKYIKIVLDFMVQFGKIPLVNTDMYAEILHSINVKSTVSSCHYLNEDAGSNDKWEEALHFVIDLIVGERAIGTPQRIRVSVPTD